MKIGWISFHFNAILDSGIKRIKGDQTEFSTIKLHGGIMVLNVTATAYLARVLRGRL